MVKDDRTSAAKALQDMGPVAEKAVVPYLSSPDWVVRGEACKILAKIGTKNLALTHLLSLRQQAMQSIASKQKNVHAQSTLKEANDAITAITTRP